MLGLTCGVQVPRRKSQDLGAVYIPQGARFLVTDIPKSLQVDIAIRGTQMAAAISNPCGCAVRAEGVNRVLFIGDAKDFAID